MSGKSRAIYERAQKRAWEDHTRMIKEFCEGRRDIATPCFDERLRKYLIEDFGVALGGSLTEVLPVDYKTLLNSHKTD